jgi:hypothetical protein
MTSGAADEPDQVAVVFRQPAGRPGTPEARAAGCLCRFGSNIGAGFLSAGSGHEKPLRLPFSPSSPPGMRGFFDADGPRTLSKYQ